MPTSSKAKSGLSKPVNTSQGAAWQGALQGQFRNFLYGWCINTQQPDARVVLEVRLNGETVGSIISDVARSDLADEFERVLPRDVTHDCCHGFVADIGVREKDLSGTFTVRVANTDVVLPGLVEAQLVDKPPVSATSLVFSDGGLRLLGWALDASDEARTLNVYAFAGTQQMAHAKANLVHPALGPFNVGTHGFSLDLPIEIADGRRHTLNVLDGDGTPLNGSPITVCCHVEGAKALLPKRPSGLLADVVEQYERYLPRSVGMQQYRRWSASFEAVHSGGVNPKRTLSIAIIVSGDADSDATQRTQASLEQQSGVNVQLFLPQVKGKAKRTFAKLLQLALQAQCDIVSCVRAGDTLPSHALHTALEGFVNVQTQLVYTDSEHQAVPWFKPAWNPEYALASDYPLDLMLVRASLFQEAGTNQAFPDNPASFAWTALSSLWDTAQQTIVHVPRVLYQYQSELSTEEKQARYSAAHHALQALEPASVLTIAPKQPPKTLFQARRIMRSLSSNDQEKTVSLIIPTRDRVELLERCISSIQQFTPWANLEILVVDNDSVQAKTKTYLRKLEKQGVTVLPVPGAFNFATLNNLAVNAARGEIVGLINNDIEALHAGWLEEIISHLLSPGVGAVGAKLLWPNGMVQHGGVLLGVGNVAGHYGNRLADDDWGDHGRNQLVQQVSAVTAACLFMRKSDYLAVGGMDPVAFPVAFNDVDLCLKLRTQGKTIVWTPHARLLHAESASRGHEDTPQKRARAQRELEQLRQRWGHVLLCDPAYHPSLNLDAHSHAYGGLALPPRNRAPRLAGLTPQAE